MIHGALICPNPKCKGSMMEEVHIANYRLSVDEDESETGRLHMTRGSDKFVYRCNGCGKQAHPKVIEKKKELLD